MSVHLDRKLSGTADLLPGLLLISAAAVAAFGLNRLVSSLSPLVAGVAIGAVLGNLGMLGRPLPARINPGGVFAAKRLLRVGIVLLGFRLALSDLKELGSTGIAVVAMVVTVTFFGTQWMGARLGLSKDLSLLVATGYSICGASAIAAMDGVIEADEEETAYAVALVTLCGSLAIVVLPLLAGPLGLSGVEFGSWVGASVHDVAQVVATASTDGDEASRSAIVVKLTRVVLLAPVVAMVALRRRRETQAEPGTARPPIVPLFVALFIGSIAIRSTGWLSVEQLSSIKQVEKVLLTLALVGLGLGVKIDRLRKLGGRPLALGLMAWFLVAVVSYVGVRVTA